MKRFVIILLALLSGLSVPQAVAAATGRADGCVIAAPLAARSVQPGEEVRARVLVPVRGLAQPSPLSVPAADFAPPAPTIRFGERARE